MPMYPSAAVRALARLVARERELVPITRARRAASGPAPVQHGGCGTDACCRTCNISDDES